MKVYGYEDRLQSLQHVAALSSVKLEHVRQEAVSWSFGVVADGCSRRRAAGWGDRPGRLTRSPSFWSMALFMARLFWVGATRVQTAMGDWRTFADFDSALRSIAERNAGSIAYPCCFGDLEAVPSDDDAQAHYIRLANEHLDVNTAALYL